MKPSDIKAPGARKLAVDAHRAGFTVHVTTNTDKMVVVSVRKNGVEVAEGVWMQTGVGGNFSRGFAVGGTTALRFNSGAAKGRFVKTLRAVRDSLNLEG